jgi:RHS repeat-associated protein
MGSYGVMQEGDSGLYYVRARYYDSETSRLISRDMSGNHTSIFEINPYSFLKNNPLLFTDVKGTNAKVIQDGIHTSIAVDIWDGNKIIGSLELSFYPKVWKKSNIPWWKYITHAAGALTNMGWPSIFEVTFKWTPEGVGTAGKNELIVPGNREADEKLARAMLNAIGFVHGGLFSNADIVRTAFPPTKRSYVKQRYSAYGYGLYRPMTQVCNDFTDEMLDIYFGENWYFGPIYFGSGLMDELKTYLSELEAKEAEQRYVEQISKLDPISQDINFHVHKYGAAVFDPSDDSGIANLYPR